MIKYLLPLVLFTSACTKQTAAGLCIGIQDKEAPNTEYTTPVINVVMAVIFFETLFVPANVAFYNAKCPVVK